MTAQEATIRAHIVCLQRMLDEKTALLEKVRDPLTSQIIQGPPALWAADETAALFAQVDPAAKEEALDVPTVTADTVVPHAVVYTNDRPENFIPQPEPNLNSGVVVSSPEGDTVQPQYGTVVYVP